MTTQSGIVQCELRLTRLFRVDRDRGYRGLHFARLVDPLLPSTANLCCSFFLRRVDPAAGLSSLFVAKRGHDTVFNNALLAVVSSVVVVYV